GEPYLELITGSTSKTKTPCTSIAGVYTDFLNFLYTVAPGDTSQDLSYSGVNAVLLVNTTVVEDKSGVDANTTLPAPGSELSMTDESNAVVVDTSNTVLHVTASNDDGVYYVGESIFLEV
ncbi:unnamed protein product, partial [Choristocarpus tenellus]